MPKKIYCFFYYYPPLNSSEGISTYKIFNFTNFDLKIFSQDKSLDWSYTSDKDLEISKEIDYRPPTDWFDAVFKEANKDDIDLIITRSMPIESHNIGLKLKKNHKNSRWIVFISDPFPFNSPIYKFEFWDSIKKNLEVRYCFKNLKKLIWYFLKIKIMNRIYWKKIVKNASLIICNNEYQEKFIKSKKAITIPHSYIKFKNLSHEKDTKIIFSYLGNITRCRNLDNYLIAINRINNIPELSERVKFQFIGCNEDELTILEKNKNVILIKSVSFKESIKIMNESNILVNVDANKITKYIKEYIYLPCKIIDYISTGNNVLNISNFLKSPTIDLVNKYGGINVKDQVEDIYQSIINILNNNKIYPSKEFNKSKFNNYFILEKIEMIINNIWKCK